MKPKCIRRPCNRRPSTSHVPCRSVTQPSLSPSQNRFIRPQVVLLLECRRDLSTSRELPSILHSACLHTELEIEAAWVVSFEPKLAVVCGTTLHCRCTAP